MARWPVSAITHQFNCVFHQTVNYSDTILEDFFAKIPISSGQLLLFIAITGFQVIVSQKRHGL